MQVEAGLCLLKMFMCYKKSAGVEGGGVGTVMLPSCPGNGIKNHCLFLMINVSAGCSSHRPGRNIFGQNQIQDGNLNQLDAVWTSWM